MNIGGKSFRNNKTGETIEVTDSFDNIALIKSGGRIEVTTLMDKSLYTEQHKDVIDPKSFFENRNYDNILKDVSNIPIDNIPIENTNEVKGFGGVATPTTTESVIVETTKEQEMEELARKYNINTDISTGINKQNEAFSKYLNDDVEVVVAKREENETVTRTEENETVTRIEILDPIITMFRNAKRTVEFNIDLNISDRIPRLDFIEMMEDSYETSIIDFLTNDITNKLLNDPTVIRDSIKAKIQELVETVNPKKHSVVETKTKTKTKTKTTNKKTKLSVNDRIKAIENASKEEIEKLLKGEKSVRVIEASKKRINEL